MMLAGLGKSRTSLVTRVVVVTWPCGRRLRGCLDNPLGVSHIENELPLSIFGHDVCSPPPQCVAVRRLYFASCQLHWNYPRFACSVLFTDRNGDGDWNGNQQSGRN
jgi:hypothetical protein